MRSHLFDNPRGQTISSWILLYLWVCPNNFKSFKRKIKCFVVIRILGKRTVCEVNITQRKILFYEHSKLKYEVINNFSIINIA
jgi:hypothetical protein